VDGPQLVRSFSSRQLSLVAGHGRVVVFAVLGGRYLGRSLQIHVPTASRLLDQLPPDIETVVFIDEPVPDAALISLIDDMVAERATRHVDAVVNFVPAVEAVKRVDGDRVAEGIDRSNLVGVRPPEVLDRKAIHEAIRGLGSRMWANPSALLAAAGGSLALFGGSHGTQVPASS
jgi:hypothetical protein